MFLYTAANLNIFKIFTFSKSKSMGKLKLLKNNTQNRFKYLLRALISTYVTAPLPPVLKRGGGGY